ncbi:hypothetical protein BJ878DRAFT_541802 [Calycina marina]|uniref:Ubiquitin-like protease family profile domain-containing protein n=1 Tax=Calycina marina TaxID=1763456 RepID=A0A9P8CF98_9HELO|nr:hypothetical protein BJ878DRAFT_541802 [Calycina marina]
MFSSPLKSLHAEPVIQEASEKLSNFHPSDEEVRIHSTGVTENHDNLRKVTAATRLPPKSRRLEGSTRPDNVDLIFPVQTKTTQHADRDANTQRSAYSVEHLPPDAVKRQQGTQWLPSQRYQDPTASSCPTYKYSDHLNDQAPSSDHTLSRDSSNGSAVPVPPLRKYKEQRSTMPKPNVPGAPKPINNLATKNRNSSVVEPGKHFHAGDHPSKRQKRSGPNHQELLQMESKSTIEASRSYSRESYTQNGSSVGGEARLRPGRVVEMRHVQNLQRPPVNKRTRARNPARYNQDQPFRGGNVQNGTRTIVRHSEIVDGEDPEDRIQDPDGDININVKSPPQTYHASKFDVAIPPFDESANGGGWEPISSSILEDDELANLRNNKSGLIRQKPPRAHGLNPNFSGAYSPKKKKKKKQRNIHSSHFVNERSDSVDELVGSCPDTQHRDASNCDEGPQNSLREPGYDAFHLPSDDCGDGNDNRSSIKRTNFRAAKNVTPEKPKHIGPYEAVYFFTEAWVICDNTTKPWQLSYNRNSSGIRLFSVEDDDNEVRIPIAKINKIDYEDGFSKMIIALSRKQSGEVPKYYIQLQNFQQLHDLRMDLVASDETLRVFKKDHPYMTNAFIKARDHLPIKAARKSNVKQKEGFHGPSVSRTRELLGKRLCEKTPRTRIIDDLKPETVSDAQPGGKSDPLSNISAERFYDNGRRISSDGKDSMPLHNTRASQLHAMPVQPRESTPDSRPWTEINPGWDKNWESAVIWPPTGKTTATVGKHDIHRLNENEYLNDNLITFYMAYLQYQFVQKRPEMSKRVYFHNTFFYHRLTTGAPGRSRINYKAVERWTRKVDLLSFDYIIVPVHESSHWYLAIICNTPKFKIENPDVTDSMEGLDIEGSDGSGSPPKKSLLDAEKRALEIDLTDDKPDPPQAPRRKSGIRHSLVEPRIMTLDSLLLNGHSATCTNLKEYIADEFKAKHGKKIVVPRNIGHTVQRLPQQPNYTDCGLFLLGYIEKFLDDPDDFLHRCIEKGFPDDYNYWPDWTGMRSRIRELIFRLHIEQAEEAKKNNKAKITKASTQKTKDLNGHEVSPNALNGAPPLSSPAPRQPKGEEATPPHCPGAESTTNDTLGQASKDGLYVHRDDDEQLQGTGYVPADDQSPQVFAPSASEEDVPMGGTSPTQTQHDTAIITSFRRKSHSRAVTAACIKSNSNIAGETAKYDDADGPPPRNHSRSAHGSPDTQVNSRNSDGDNIIEIPDSQPNSPGQHRFYSHGLSHSPRGSSEVNRNVPAEPYEHPRPSGHSSTFHFDPEHKQILSERRGGYYGDEYDDEAMPLLTPPTKGRVRSPDSRPRHQDSVGPGTSTQGGESRRTSHSSRHLVDSSDAMVVGGYPRHPSRQPLSASSPRVRSSPRSNRRSASQVIELD